jgi:CheY-like chemotaxis protein
MAVSGTELARCCQPLRHARAAREKMMESQARVVVVDDDADVLESLLQMLGALRGGSGAEGVVGAADAAAALALVAQHNPDMVVIDLALPKVDDGLELVRSLRSAYGRDLLLVVLTGTPEHLSYDAALAAGCDHVLFKPAGLQQLARMIMPLPVA